MKQLHRDDLFGWSVFDPGLDIDFNSVAWIRKGGNVLVDPLPLGEHDEEHLERLGGAAWIVLTNSAHVRGAEAIARRFGAKVCGPQDERSDFPLKCDRWLEHDEEVVPDLIAYAMDGSKTPGELALLLDRKTLITGDLVRGARPGKLNMLADEKLESRDDAERSIWRLLEHKDIETVLVGDGWHLFGDGWAKLHEVVEPDAGKEPAAKRVGFQV